MKYLIFGIIVSTLSHLFCMVYYNEGNITEIKAHVQINQKLIKELQIKFCNISTELQKLKK